MLPQEHENNVEDNIIQDMPLWSGIAALRCNMNSADIIISARAFCTRCSFASPDLDYAVTELHNEKGRLEMRLKESAQDFKMVGPSITDAYNLAGSSPFCLNLA